jgi:hypothetical protein
MAAPTSATLAETFIQHLEHTIIYKILQKHQIIDYYRYGDDMLIIYNKHHNNIDNTIDEFNKIHNRKGNSKQNKLFRFNNHQRRQQINICYLKKTHHHRFYHT